MNTFSLKEQTYMTKLFTAFFLTFALISCGQDKPRLDKEKIKIDKICDQVMQGIFVGKVHDALDILKQNTAIPGATIDTMEVSMTSHVDKIFPAYGRILSYEFVMERKIKDFIAKRFYVLRFEKYYLKFDFTLYNNGKSWAITNFNYNDDLIEVLY